MSALPHHARPVPVPQILGGLALLIGIAHVLNVAARFPQYQIASDSDLALLMAGMLLATASTAMASAETRKRARLEGSAWLSVALALASIILGIIVTAFMTATGQSLTPPTVLDAISIVSRLMFITAHVLFLSRSSTRAFWLRTGLELIVLALGMLLLYSELGLEPLAAHGSASLGTLFGAIYPAFDLVLVWMALALLARYNRPPLPLALLILASVLYGCADAVFNLPTVKSALQPNATSGIASLLFSATTLTMTFAAATQIRQPFLLRLDASQASTGLENTGLFARGWPYLQMAMPLCWIGVVYVILLSEPSGSVFQFGALHGAIIRIGAGLILVIVVLRQWLQLRDKQNLGAQLQRLLQSSEMLSAPAQGEPGLVVLRELRKLMPFDHAALVLFSDDKPPAGLRLAGATDTPVPFAARDHAIWLDRLARQRLRLSITRASDERARSDEDRLQQLLFPGGEMRVRSWAAVSLLTRDRPVGLLAVASHQHEQFAGEQLELLSAFGRQAVATLESARLLTRERTAAVIAERSRLARDLHDSVSQAIFGALLGIKTARETVTSDVAKSRSALDYAETLADAALVEMRALIYELRPETLREEGLVGALEKQVAALCKRHNLEARLSIPSGEPSLPFEVKEALYRIALEAVQNTVRHARARTVTISLLIDPAALTMTIRDDGRGFDTTTRLDGHFGLSTMHARATQLGADLRIDSRRANEGPDPSGTTVTLVMPFSPRA